MRSDFVAMLLIALVVAGLGISNFVVNNDQQAVVTTSTAPSSSTTTVQTPSSPCSEPFNYDSVNPLSVLVARPNSTGQICVEYANSLNNTESLPTYHDVYEYNKSGSYGVCPSCTLDVVTSIRVIPSQSNVTFVPNGNPSDETTIVTYTVHFPSNVTEGVYGIFLLQFCSLFPVLVANFPNGAGPVIIAKSDFTPWYPHQGSCPAQVLGAQVLGVSGFGVVSTY
jgi:hypothetical protein